jgi:hypothetical protein
MILIKNSHLPKHSQTFVIWPLLALRSKRLKIAVGDMLLTNPERVASCVLFCKSIFTKPLVFKNGQHCGEYRVIYHKNNGNRFFLSFEAKYPNPEPSKGKKGCAAVADFWVNIGYMSKTDALLQLEKFFYQGIATKITREVNPQSL